MSEQPGVRLPAKQPANHQKTVLDCSLNRGSGTIAADKDSDPDRQFSLLEEREFSMKARSQPRSAQR
jgi:hypothetical protein